MTGRTRRVRKNEGLKERENRGFGKHVPWVPEGLPAEAVQYWPRKHDWPTTADVRGFLERTDGRPDVRLAVLTGLRRWAEPASSQMVLTVAAIIISVVAVALSVSDFEPLFHIGMVGAGVAYVVVAFLAIGLALAMDQRRKMAHVWLTAIEAELFATSAPSKKQAWFSPRGSRVERS